MIPVEALQKARVTVALVGRVAGLDPHAPGALLVHGGEDEARVEAAPVGYLDDGAPQAGLLGGGVGADPEPLAGAGVEVRVARVERGEVEPVVDAGPALRGGAVALVDLVGRLPGGEGGGCGEAEEAGEREGCDGDHGCGLEDMGYTAGVQVG